MLTVLSSATTVAPAAVQHHNDDAALSALLADVAALRRDLTDFAGRLFHLQTSAKLLTPSAELTDLSETLSALYDRCVQLEFNKAQLSVHFRPHRRWQLDRRLTWVDTAVNSLYMQCQQLAFSLLEAASCAGSSGVHSWREVLVLFGTLHRLWQLHLAATSDVWLALHRPPELQRICLHVAGVRAVALSAVVESHFIGVHPLNQQFLQHCRRRQLAAAPLKTESATSSAEPRLQQQPTQDRLRLPPVSVPAIRLERSTPTSGYDSDTDQQPAVVATQQLSWQLEQEAGVLHALLQEAVHHSHLLPQDATGRGQSRHRLSGWRRRRLAALYGDQMWLQCCRRLTSALLWNCSRRSLSSHHSVSSAVAAQPARRFRGPLAAVHVFVAVAWTSQVDAEFCDELTELGLSMTSLTSQLRHVTAAVMSCHQLTPALRLCQSTRHVPVLLHDGQYATLCGKHFYDGLSCVVARLNDVFVDQLQLMLFVTDGTVVAEDSAPSISNVLPSVIESLQLSIVTQLTLQYLLCLGVTRMQQWVLTRSQLLVSTWQTSAYFLLTMSDLPRSAVLLNTLQTNPPLDEVALSSGLDALLSMRTASNRKLDRTVERLQGVEAANMTSVSDCCRRTALASLRTLFPGRAYWQQTIIITSHPSPYVKPYIGQVLEEVLAAISRLDIPLQQTVGRLVVKVACHAWMDHILKQKIKFSYAGARQLARDFRALRDWLLGHQLLSESARLHLLSADTLHELDGVTRLLLRQPHQLQPSAHQLVRLLPSRRRSQVRPASMSAPPPRRPSTGSAAGEPPPELYVRDPQRWLSLRMRRQPPGDAHQLIADNSCFGCCPARRHDHHDSQQRPEN